MGDQQTLNWTIRARAWRRKFEKKNHDLTITATPVASEGEIQTPEQTNTQASVTTINTVRN